MLIDMNLIDLGERVREELGDVEDLIESFKRVGQLQPILVRKIDDGTYVLVAGERRFRAMLKAHAQEAIIKDVPPGMIKAEIEGELSDDMKLMMEFEENERRKEMTFQEKAKYVRKFHQHFMEQSGGKWSGEMTALALKLSPASVSYYLDLHDMIEQHPEVANAKTMRGAIKRVKTIRQIEHRKEIAKRDETVGQKKAEEAFKCMDGVEWLRSLPPESIDLVNLDPPWGENVSYKTWRAWDGGAFDDSAEYASEIIPLLLEQSLRVLKPNRFCIFWYRTWAYNEMLSLVESTGFSTKHAKTPCIWYKPDKVSDQMSFPEKQLISSYETFLIIRKGDPVFYEKEVQNVFVEPRVPVSELIHPTEKPVSLLERLIKLCTVPGETVLDPTAGSASTLVAAYKSLRKPLGCEYDAKLYSNAFLRLAEVMK